MIFEFIGSLFDFGIIVLMILTFVAGFAIGFFYLTSVGNVVWFVILAFIQLLIFDSLDEFQASHHSGVLLAHIALHPALLILSIKLGRKSKQIDIHERTTAANSQTPVDFVTELNILGSHPDLAQAGWFESRWNRMSTPERLEWTTAATTGLRKLWADGSNEGEKLGLEKYGTNLPMMLAKIDVGIIKHTPAIVNDSPTKIATPNTDSDEHHPEFFAAQFNLLATQPTFTTGWFTERWSKMDKAERLAWATHHRDALQQIWDMGDDVGFVRHGFDLSNRLSALDITMLTDRVTTLLEKRIT